MGIVEKSEYGETAMQKRSEVEAQLDRLDEVVKRTHGLRERLRPVLSAQGPELAG